MVKYKLKIQQQIQQDFKRLFTILWTPGIIGLNILSQNFC